jgi:hypothetical protein
MTHGKESSPCVVRRGTRQWEFTVQICTMCSLACVFLLCHAPPVSRSACLPDGNKCWDSSNFISGLHIIHILPSIFSSSCETERRAASCPEFLFFIYFYTKVHDSMTKAGMILFFSVTRVTYWLRRVSIRPGFALHIILPERQKPAPCSFSIDSENRKRKKCLYFSIAFDLLETGDSV